MKKVVRENICAPYSLHDMSVISFEIKGDDMIMRTQSGIVSTVPPYGQPDGYVEFHKIDWDFSYVYLLDVIGNTGSFTGEKIHLKDFVKQFVNANFSIIDETYGYNQTKFEGFLSMGLTVKECFVGIYHLGDIVFVEE